MASDSIAKLAGEKLRELIKENYKSQEDFAYDFQFYDLRTISRYINNGINSIATIQVFAEFFHVPFIYFVTE